MLRPFFTSFTTSIHLSKVIPSLISCHSFLLGEQEDGVSSALHPITPPKGMCPHVGMNWVAQRQHLQQERSYWGCSSWSCSIEGDIPLLCHRHQRESISWCGEYVCTGVASRAGSRLGYSAHPLQLAHGWAHVGVHMKGKQAPIGPS